MVTGLSLVAVPFCLRLFEVNSTSFGSEVRAKNPEQKEHKGSPGSSGPIEDLDAWYAGKRKELIANDRQNDKLIWAPIGERQVVDDEGASVGVSDGLNGYDDCKTACEKEALCHSFTLCGANCYMKNKVL